MENEKNSVGEKEDTRIGVLREAIRLTAGDRNTAYGKPIVNLQQNANLWNAYVGQEMFTAQDVSIMMALTKIARIRTNPSHHDSHVDASAYMAIAKEVWEDAQDG